MQFGATMTACAGVALERGDVERATQLAEQVLEEALRCGHISTAVWADLVLGRVHLAVGDMGAAARVAARVRTLATKDTPDSALCVPVDQFRAAVLLAAGDSLRAERVIRGLPASNTRSLLWAQAGLTTHPVAARRTLETLGAGTPRTQAQRHLLLAAVHARTSRSMAQGHLRKAARIAEVHGLGQLLSGADPGLLDFARSCAMEHQDDNLDRLLQNRPSPRPAAGSPGPQAPLSRGELQLLSVLPTRARNADIAASLGVSVNTVKTRLRRLYAKLGASSRDEAIERARERGLVSD
jgi:LuxR family maltose regulon positive regulatory protein